MIDKENIPNVCCEYCSINTEDCPMISASPWSKWDYCSHFRDHEGKTIPEVLEGKK